LIAVSILVLQAEGLSPTLSMVPILGLLWLHALPLAVHPIQADV
jgi:hypothetical protein